MNHTETLGGIPLLKRALNRLVSVELGPSYNIAMSQGTDEAWVIGRLEKLKSLVFPHTRGYFSRLKSFGIGFNQILFFAAIVYLPSLSSLLDRSILMIGVLLISLMVKWIQDRIFQNAVVYLSDRQPTVIERAVPPLISLLVAIMGGTAAALLAAFLQGWFAR